jgi:uncharacterized protein
VWNQDEMTRSAGLRVFVTAALLAGEAVLAMMLVVAAPTSLDAQFFWDQNRRRSPFDWFEQQQQPQQYQTERQSAPVDYSRAPAPKKADPKAEGAVTTPILVLGDSMADWLGYGLEQAYADAPEIGILRRHKTNSGLIRSETKSDPRGEYPDWPQAAREQIASQKPKFVLMMVGINDRRQLREVTQAAPRPVAPKPAAPAQTSVQAQGEDAAAADQDKPPEDKPQQAAPPAPQPPPAPAAPVVRNLEFHTDAWSEAYSRRIDETIAALKTSGVPVFWVGLPPLRGQKASADIPYLNDLYRGRADKAGIIYIDVWDGFVDEDGRYVQYGPDVEGQTRRLRTADGAYFTQAGARKLAHYVQREIERWMNNRAAPVAVAVPVEPKETKESKAEAAAAAKAAGPRARPVSGPAVPLTAERAVESDELIGGNSTRQPTNDAMAAKVLVRGEPVSAPAGRADDFAWPRRDVAPVGADPVVATTDLPMTPMVADRNGAITVAAAPGADPSGKSSAPSQQPAKPALHRPRPYYADNQGLYRPDYRRPQPVQQQFGFPSLFGGGGWWR